MASNGRDDDIIDEDEETLTDDGDDDEGDADIDDEEESAAEEEKSNPVRPREGTLSKLEKGFVGGTKWSKKWVRFDGQYLMYFAVRSRSRKADSGH